MVISRYFSLHELLCAVIALILIIDILIQAKGGYVHMSMDAVNPLRHIFLDRIILYPYT
jgi:hypothetical protein